MKLTLAILAVLGLATASAIPAAKTRNTRDLKTHWDDFLALIPTDELLDICVQYLAEDSQVQTVVAYMQSDDFKTLINTIDQTDEWQAVLNHCANGGLDVWTYRQILLDWMDSSSFTVSARSLTKIGSARITGGIAGLYADLKACLPLSDLRALFQDKVANHADFAYVVEYVKSAETQAAVSKLAENETVQYMYNALAGFGLDMEYVRSFCKSLLGWE